MKSILVVLVSIIFLLKSTRAQNEEVIAISVYPSAGPYIGGQRITITGTNLTETKQTWSCLFTSLTDGSQTNVTASLCSANDFQRICCVTPFLKAPHATAVQAYYVFNDTTHVSQPPLNYTAYAIPTVYQVMPLYSYKNGGYMLTVQGANFPNLPGTLYQCAYHMAPGTPTAFTVYQPAVLVPEQSAVVCNSSAQLASNVTFQLSVDGMLYPQDSAYPFAYYDVPTINKISPMRGPIGLEYFVTIYGSPLLAHWPFLCQFGSQQKVFAFCDPDQDGLMCSNQALLCAVNTPFGPFSPSPSPLLSDSESGNVSASIGYLPLTVYIGQYHVLSNLGIQFLFYPLPSVGSLTPSVGMVFGGNSVTVTGASFPMGSSYCCLFGSVQACSSNDQAFWSSTTEVVCIVPKGNPGTVTFQLVIDGHLYPQSPLSNLTYTFKADDETIVILASAIPSACFFVFALSVFVIWFRKKRRAQLDDMSYERMTEESLSKVIHKMNSLVQIIRFSDVKLGARIGVGTCGEVYRGRWRGCDVAVKRLRILSEDAKEDLLSEFADEVMVLHTLSHPNVCQFLGVIVEPDITAIVSELMPRGSLYKMLHSTGMTDENPEGIEKKEWDTRRIVSMARDAAAGMAYLHGLPNPIIHRDLKSPNLLVAENFVVKVTDFGISRFKDMSAATMTVGCGSPFWMAPEIVKESHYNEKVDVYSFAIIMWEMLSRRVPYEGMSPLSVPWKVAHEGLRPSIPPHCPEPLAALIRQCWEDDPADRPTFETILDTLESILEDLGGAPPLTARGGTGGPSSMQAQSSYRTFSAPRRKESV